MAPSMATAASARASAAVSARASTPRFTVARSGAPLASPRPLTQMPVLEFVPPPVNARTNSAPLAQAPVLSASGESSDPQAATSSRTNAAPMTIR